MATPNFIRSKASSALALKLLESLSSAPSHTLSALVPGASILHTLEHDWQAQVLVMVRDRLPRVLVVLLCLFAVERAVRFLVKRIRRIAAHHSQHANREAQMRTMAAILRATTLSVLGFVAFLQVLYLLNINYAPLLASAGIVGVGIGLAAQSLFKDIINGVFILTENQYNVGEVVKVAGISGTVEDLTLRLTRVRDFDGNLNVIPNSQIATVTNFSRDFAVAALTVSVDASADPTRVVALLTRIAQEVKAEEAFREPLLSDPDVPGIDRINGRELVYPISMRVRVSQKDAVLRALRQKIVETFKQERIPLGMDPANFLLQQQARPDPTSPPAQQPLVHS